MTVGVVAGYSYIGAKVGEALYYSLTQGSSKVNESNYRYDSINPIEYPAIELDYGY